VFVSDANRPVQIIKGNTLLCSSHPESYVAILDGCIALGRQPFGQVAIDFEALPRLLVRRDKPRQLLAPVRGSYLLVHTLGHTVRISLHVLDQLDSAHAFSLIGGR
jgi:hypothetical protein